MNTANQLSTQDFRQNLILNSLTKPDLAKEVYDFSGGYNVIDWYVTKGKTGRRIYGDDGEFQKPIRGRGAVSALIASTPVLVGNDLLVTFTDPNYDKFRVGFVVSDGSSGNFQGRVKQVNPGSILIEIAPPVTAFDPALHFVAGRYATEMFNASVNRGSDVPASLFNNPTYVKNHTSITREGLTMYRRDFMQTWVESYGDYWGMQQERDLLQRYAFELEYKALFGEYGQRNSFDGIVNYSMGLKAAIKDGQRGGITRTWTNLPTVAQFLSFISDISDRNTNRNNEIDLFVGRGMLNVLQSYNTQQIVNTGIRNTVGGDTVSGFDSYQYAISGIKTNFIMLPLFNDEDRYPAASVIPGANYRRQQYTMIALNRGEYTSVDGKKLPMAEKVYFGDKEVAYGIVQGITGTFGVGDMKNSGSVVNAANGKDGVTFGLYSDCAYDFMGYGAGWAELAY